MASEQRRREFRIWLGRQSISKVDSQTWWQGVKAAGLDDLSFEEAIGEVERATREMAHEIDAMKAYLQGPGEHGIDPGLG